MSVFNAIKGITTKLFRPTVTKGWEELSAGIMTVGGTTGPGTLAPTVQTYQALKKYRSWVYPCVNLISRKVTTVPYYLYKAEHKYNREEFKRVYDHPVIKLLNHPNDFLSGRQLKEIIQMHLDLCGFAFVRIHRNGAGQPVQLFPYYPQELLQIELGTTSDNLIKAFHFAPIQNRLKVERIPYKDMLYFHYPHPQNPYMPLTPIEAMSHATDIELLLEEYTKNFFINGAQPAFVIIPEKQISKEAAERVTEGWMAKFRGPGKSHKPAVLSENVKIQMLGVNAHDFEFVGMSNWTQEHILAAYGVPKAMFGLMGGTSRSENLNTEAIFINNCILRRLHLFEDVINHQLISQYRNLEGYEFEHANPLPRDDEWEVTKDQTQWSMGLIALNEIRRRDGEEPWKSKLADVPFVNGAPLPGCDEEADRIWKEFSAPPQIPGMPVPGDPNTPTPKSNVPEAQGAHGAEGGRPSGTTLASLVQATLRNARPNLSMLLNAARGKRGGLAALVEAHPETASLGNLLASDRKDPGLQKLLTRGIRDYLIDEELEEDEVDMFETTEDFLCKMTPVIESYQDESDKFFVTKGIEIAEIVKKAFSEITTKEPVFDLDEESLKEDYKDQAGPYVIKAVNLGFELGYQLVEKAGGNVKPPDEYDKAALRGANKFLNKSADLKVKSTKKVLLEIIKEGLDKGLGSEEVSEMIVAKFKDIGGKRAELIAVTELSAAAIAGQDAAYQKINQDAGKLVVKETTFYPSLDERTCKECDDLKDKVVKDYATGKEFIQIPVHPRCRCNQQPVLSDDLT